MQKSKLPSLITIMILTLITALMWIGFGIYRAFTKTAEPSVPANISAAIVPSLDAAAINNVESALFFTDTQIPQITFLASPSPVASMIPTPRPTSSPIASPSATPEVTPTPTEEPVVP